MLTSIKQSKILMVLAAVFLMAAFFLAFFHSHEDGANHDCALCRFVQAFAVLFCTVFLFLTQLSSQKFSPVYLPSLHSAVLSSRLRGRAPPRLF